MGRKIEIVGGSCSVGRISFCSDRFKSTTELKGKKIVTTVEDLGWAGKISQQDHDWPLPETVKLLIRVFLLLDLKDVIYVCIFNFALRLPVWWAEDKYQGKTLGLWPVLAVTFVVMGVIAWIFRYAFGKWHAAEHMASNAFQDLSSVRLNDIAKSSPIHVACGGRMLTPLVMIAIISTLVSGFWGINAWWPLLALMELFLQAEKRFKLSQRGFFGYCSFILQKYVTTRTPDFREIQVAKAALDGLTNKHNTTRQKRKVKKR
jgi:hypothetical protein